MRAKILSAFPSPLLWGGLALLAALGGALFLSDGLVSIARASATYQRQIQLVFSMSMQEMGSGTNPAALWLLLSLCFTYGVVHTLGPGHGKAVIAAYFLDGHTPRALRDGFFAAGWIALTHTLSALLLAAVLKLMSVAGLLSALSHARWVEIGSYAMIVLIGLWRLRTALQDHRADCDVCGVPHGRAPMQVPMRGIRVASAPLMEGPLSNRPLANGPLANGPSAKMSLTGGHQGPGFEQARRTAALTCDVVEGSPRGFLGDRSGLLLLTAAGAAPCPGALILVLLALALDVLWAGIAGVLAIALGMAMALAGIGMASMFAHRLIIADERTTLLRRLIAVAAALIVIGTAATLLLGAVARQFGWA
jgi:nickel/cobalt transporter (NicO) family protein